MTLQPPGMARLVGMIAAITFSTMMALPAGPALANDAVGQIAAALEPTRSIVYKTAGELQLRLHFFEPQGFQPSDRRACFLIIHGGGWRGLSPRRMYPFAAHFARLGMVGICPEYRLVRPDAGVSVFDCVRDSRSA
ncbi:MAG: hypothetical protein U1E05_18345, partial [Patescibacteria group bacterium]|nr:hypothetical protein [Patescibacteria group bacterium]